MGWVTVWRKCGHARAVIDEQEVACAHVRLQFLAHDENPFLICVVHIGDCAWPEAEHKVMKQSICSQHAENGICAGFMQHGCTDGWQHLYPNLICYNSMHYVSGSQSTDSKVGIKQAMAYRGTIKDGGLHAHQ